MIITTCTGRKRIVPKNYLCARNLSSSSAKSLARNWLARIANAQPSGRASELYCGRNFTEARNSASHLSGELVFLSAGLGLVASTEKIPAYSLTLSRGSADYVGAKVNDASWRPSDWWSQISAGHYGPRSIGEIADQDPNAIILVTLSQSYAELMADELKNLSTGQLAQFRLFGASLLKTLPERIAANVMPFDARLDGPESCRLGTMSDFAVRALSVFADLIEKGQVTLQSCAADAAAVEKHISEWTFPLRIVRERQSDEEILCLINKHWDQVGGRSTKMLPFLRRQLGVACEQSRFAKLFRNVAENRNQKGVLL